jgi:solute carrier family 25 2-oxodicarboxylate transporter 21
MSLVPTHHELLQVTPDGSIGEWQRRSDGTTVLSRTRTIDTIAGSENDGASGSGVLFIAGALSGIAEAIVVQPFDMVKTRHQINPGSNPGVYRTLMQLRQEGGVRLWYRGFVPEVIGMVPKSSAMYGTYGTAHKYLSAQEGTRRNTTLVASVAGLASGISEAIIVTPSQIVKVRLQAREHDGRYSGPVDCCRKLVAEEGLRSFFIGLRPTLWRNCVWNTVYFGLMDQIRRSLPATSSKLEASVQTFGSGFVGAITATCFNAPFDVVKSRFQCQVPQNDGQMKYRNTLQSLALIWREEGTTAVYKGFRPKSIRMGLGGATAMLVYEFTIGTFL